jgi:hypothetical protein
MIYCHPILKEFTMPGQSFQTFLDKRSGRQILHRIYVGMVLAALLPSGCTDLRDYTGTWQGNIVRSSYLRQGFDSDTSAVLTIESIDRSTLIGHLELTPVQDSTSGFDATLIPVVEAENDALGDMSFDGDPLSTYLFFVAPVDTAEASALVILSAHAGDRIEMRILRHDLYGVFKLSK